MDEVPFDFERRRVSVLISDGATRVLVVKGAPEDIIALSTAYRWTAPRVRSESPNASAFSRCSKSSERRDTAFLPSLSRHGRGHESAAAGDETELTFAGFALFVDPPKVDAARAMRRWPGRASTSRS